MAQSTWVSPLSGKPATCFACELAATSLQSVRLASGIILEGDCRPVTVGGTSLPDGAGHNPIQNGETEPRGDQPSSDSRTTAEPSAVAPSSGWPRAERKNLLIFVLAGFLLPSLALILLERGAIRDAAGFTLRSEFTIKSITALCVVLATWIVARREGRTLRDYGVPPREALGRRFWEGCLWGFAMLSLLLLLLGVSGHFRIDSLALTGAAICHYAFGWAAVFLAVAISEEFAFRGYWLFLTAKRLRFWPAAIFLSVIFAVAHIPNHGETGLGILQVFATGMLFCLMIRRTGTLWFAVGFHAAWDWAQTYFYGTPDSGLLGEGHYLNTSSVGPQWLTGGSAGPEGSVIALVVLSFCSILIHLRFRKALYPDRPA